MVDPDHLCPDMLRRLPCRRSTVHQRTRILGKENLLILTAQHFSETAKYYDTVYWLGYTKVIFEIFILGNVRFIFRFLHLSFELS